MVYAHAVIKNNRIRASDPEVDDTTIAATGMSVFVFLIRANNRRCSSSSCLGGSPFINTIVAINYSMQYILKLYVEVVEDIPV